MTEWFFIAPPEEAVEKKKGLGRGHHGHKGRPGKVGGSQPGKGGAAARARGEAKFDTNATQTHPVTDEAIPTKNIRYLPKFPKGAKRQYGIKGVSGNTVLDKLGGWNSPGPKGAFPKPTWSWLIQSKDGRKAGFWELMPSGYSVGERGVFARRERRGMPQLRRGQTLADVTEWHVWGDKSLISELFPEAKFVK